MKDKFMWAVYSVAFSVLGLGVIVFIITGWWPATWIAGCAAIVIAYIGGKESKN